MTYIIKHDNVVHFDYSLHSASKKLTSIVSDLSKQAQLNRTKQKDALALLLLNLSQAKGERVAISMDNNHEVDSRYKSFNVSVTTLRTTVNKLVAANLLVLTEGKSLPYDNGIRSTIYPTSKLAALISNLAPNTQSKELVLLRMSGENKGQAGLVGYSDTNRSKRIRKELQAYNDLLSTADILLIDHTNGSVLEDLNNQIISRKFIDNGEVDSQGNPLFNSGGRSYAKWCSLNESTQRAYITIDGEETTEEDFTASSINIIYRVVTGKSYQGDPYQIVVGKHNVPRHLVKATAACAQNNNADKSISSAVGKRYREASVSTDPNKLKHYQEYKAFKKKVTINKVLQAFLDKHKVISHLLMRGKEVGNKIQCLESDLVFAIVNELTKQGIPCLTVHDSFIVKKKDLLTLRTLMTTTDFPDKSLLKGVP